MRIANLLNKSALSKNIDYDTLLDENQIEQISASIVSIVDIICEKYNGLKVTNKKRAELLSNLIDPEVCAYDYFDPIESKIKEFTKQIEDLEINKDPDRKLPEIKGLRANEIAFKEAMRKVRNLSTMHLVFLEKDAEFIENEREDAARYFKDSGEQFEEHVLDPINFIGVDVNNYTRGQREFLLDSVRSDNNFIKLDSKNQDTKIMLGNDSGFEILEQRKLELKKSWVEVISKIALKLIKEEITKIDSNDKEALEPHVVSGSPTSTVAPKEMVQISSTESQHQQSN